MDKKRIIEKFRDGIQKIGFILQQIVIDEDKQDINNIESRIKKQKMYMTQAMFRQNEVNNSIPEPIQDEITSRVDSAIILGYSDLGDFVANSAPTKLDLMHLKQSYQNTSINLRRIPDEISGMFKDKDLNFKNLCACVGIKTIESNQKNAKATFEWLEKMETPQIKEKSNRFAKKM